MESTCCWTSECDHGMKRCGSCRKNFKATCLNFCDISHIEKKGLGRKFRVQYFFDIVRLRNENCFDKRKVLRGKGVFKNDTQGELKFL